MDANGDPSWDEEADWPDSDVESDTVRCPECGAEIYEDVELCPRCGFYVEGASDHSLADRPRWFVVLGVLGILATLLVLSGLLSLI